MQYQNHSDLTINVHNLNIVKMNIVLEIFNDNKSILVALIHECGCRNISFFLAETLCRKKTAVLAAERDREKVMRLYNIVLGDAMPFL